MAPIIRTCSAAALAFALTAGPAFARRDAPSALSHYVTARILDSQAGGPEAARAYALALDQAPANERVAARAYREAIDSGDRALALRAAHALDALQRLPQDARLLLLGEALAKGDWRGGRLQLDRLEEAGGFDFLVPALRAWVDFGARDAQSAPGADGQNAAGLGSVYLREQQALILLAEKQASEGASIVKALARTDPRGTMLRLAAAARLTALGESGKALDLLGGDEAAARAARKLVEAGKPLPGAIGTASEGTAFAIARVAGDLLRETGSAASLTLARIASFAAPGNEAIRLTLAQALANGGRTDEALSLLDGLGPVHAAAARDIRIAALDQAGRGTEALAAAQAAAALADAEIQDHARLGDAYGRLKRHDEAARAYEQALRLAGDNPPWNLWLLYGAVLDQAGNWEKAKPALQKAVAAGPDQPAALNHLGYAMLEHGDDLDEATRLIAKASALRPEDAAITDSLGWAFYLRGQPDQSIPLLEKAVAADPTEAAVGEHLGDAYWAAGRHVDARYAWRAALIQTEDAEASARIMAKIADGLPARAR